MNDKIKVTDLEKFVLEQVFRPYQYLLLGEDAPRLEKLTKEYCVDNVLHLLNVCPGWANYTIDRIMNIGFYFPKYIKHPLVDMIKELQEAHDYFFKKAN